MELGITWGNGTTFNNGGHELTLVSMNLSGGSGTMMVLDPWGAGGGTNAGTAGVAETLTVSTLNLTAANLPGYDAAGNYLEITCPITVSGRMTHSRRTAQLRAGGGQMGIIDADTIETLVPEPTKYCIARGRFCRPCYAPLFSAGYQRSTVLKEQALRMHGFRKSLFLLYFS